MIEVFHLSEAGGHAVNEDALEIRALPDGQEGFLCALADGQGGQAGGARASKAACQAVMREALQLSMLQLLGPGPWLDILHKADQMSAMIARLALQR
jgi:serine/threonine protein phosphatase PrpC